MDFTDFLYYDLAHKQGVIANAFGKKDTKQPHEEPFWVIFLVYLNMFTFIALLVQLIRFFS